MILRFDKLQNVAIGSTVAVAVQWVEKLKECAVCYNFWLLEHVFAGVLQKVEQWQRGESA